jgi:carbonic anhydrase
MRDLILGIVDFREQLLPQYRERFEKLGHEQKPDTFFITCSDSRVVPNLLVSTAPGNLFTMRNVGNLVPPATAEGISTGDVSEASAIEYSILELNVKNIIVCGHSHCGAMKAILGNKSLDGTPNLQKWLHLVKTAAFRLQHEGPLDDGFEPWDQLSQLNVLVQLEHLMTYSIVREQVAQGNVSLGGWWFQIASGDMYAYERTTRRFELIDRIQAERLIARLDGGNSPAPSAPAAS